MLEAVADPVTIGLVLVAALLHASWNALTKASGDPLLTITVISATGGLCGLPLIVALPFPGRDVWPWLALSAVIHYVYQLALVRTYQLGDLSQVYPIARGLAPLGIACLAAVGTDEVLETGQIVGLALASGAIISLGSSRPAGVSTKRAVGMAVVTAGLIGSYTYSDARGVRLADHAAIYIGWSFLLACIPLVATTVALRRNAGLASLERVGVHAFGGGLMATLGYAIALWAMSRAPMAVIASLRESSVLFAAFLGSRMLGESFGRRRMASAVMLFVGLVLVQLRWN
jgi:drug/metabolite transporter (DMT)-like permease